MGDFPPIFQVFVAINLVLIVLMIIGRATRWLFNWWMSTLDQDARKPKEKRKPKEEYIEPEDDGEIIYVDFEEELRDARRN